jgi:hypothetical protein
MPDFGTYIALSFGGLIVVLVIVELLERRK